MSEVLTIAEIQSQFDSEWVLVGDPNTDTSLKVRSGSFIYHGKERDEAYRKAIEL